MYYGATRKRNGLGFDWDVFADIFGSGAGLASSIWGNNAVTSLPIYQGSQYPTQTAPIIYPQQSGISTTTILLIGGIAVVGILFLTQKKK